VAIVLAVVFALATTTVLVQNWILRELAREIRVLDAHAQDIENQMIRHGLAGRSDFPPWNGTSTDEKGEGNVGSGMQGNHRQLGEDGISIKPSGKRGIGKQP